MPIPKFRRFAFLLLTTSCLAGSSAYGEEPSDAPDLTPEVSPDRGLTRWTTFLHGISGEASIPEQPVHWDDQTNFLWKTPLSGYGQSSPILWDGNVYVTSVAGDQKESCIVQCLDLQTGKEKWKHQSVTANLIKNDDYHSRAAITAVADENGVIVGFECGKLLAFQHDGLLRWEKDLFEEFGAIETNHGISSSLAQSSDAVYFWVPRGESPYLLAVDKQRGTVLWKKDIAAGTSWSSPVMAPMSDGTVHLVLSCTGVKPAPGFLIGLDSVSGDELWRLDGLSGNTSQTPTCVSPGEMLVGASTGRDGGPAKESVSTNGLVRVIKIEGGYEASYAWRSTKGTCGFCSPCHYRGFVYFTDRRGIVTCYSLKDGEEQFSERLGESVWATPFGLGGNVYFPGELGKTFVVKAGQKFELGHTNQLWGSEIGGSTEEGDARSEAAKQRQYAIVYADRLFLIRSGSELIAISSPVSP